MPPPRNPGSVSAFNDKTKLAVLVEQFVADLPSLDSTTLATLSVIAGGPKEDALPINTVKEHLTKTPNRIKPFLLQAIPAMPYYKVFRPYEVFDAEYLFHEVGAEVFKVLGETRFHLCILYLHEKWNNGAPPQTAPSGSRSSDVLVVAPMPETAAIDAALAKFEAARMPFSQMLQNQLAQRADEAGKALVALRVENETRLAEMRGQLKKEMDAHARGKATLEEKLRKEAETAMAKAKAEWRKAEEALQAKVDQLEAKLEAAKRTEPVAGLTPADIDRVRAEVEREFRDQLDLWKHDTVAPWLDMMQQAKAGHDAAEIGLELGRKALELAREEASRDLLAKWREHPVKAQAIIEKHLAEVDLLVEGTVEPSAALQKLHADLRSALDECRRHVERITREKPKTLMVGAIGSTIKKLGFEDLMEVAHSINNLAEHNVLTPDEGTEISRRITAEVSMRRSKGEHTQAPSQLLSGEIAKGQEVEILIDAYNFMHLSPRHFGKLGQPCKVKPGKRYFGKEARAKLAEMVAVIPRRNPKARVLVFLDGQECEERRPKDGVQMIVPTQQKMGDGQADAEIIHYIKGKLRPGVSFYVVSDDRQLQQAANRHLRPGVFSRLLEELKS